MDIKRRILLKNLAGAAIITSTPAIVIANDYSRKNNPDQQKYTYNPFLPNQKIQEANTIQNNILPNSNMQSFWDKPRMIFLKNSRTGESARIVYFNNGQINEKGYRLACHLLRDVRQNKTINIDLRLLDLVCAVQSWLIHFGFNGPILVNSGYRTRQTNSGLEGAAKNSMHLYGKAIDFTVPGFSPAMLAKIATQFKAGGVGIYHSSNFLHLDTGGVRVWSRK